MRKSSSQADLKGPKNKLAVPENTRKTNLIGSMHEQLDKTTDIGIDHSNENLNFSKLAHSELDLDYLDELELNRAFSIFKDI